MIVLFPLFWHEHTVKTIKPMLKKRTARYCVDWWVITDYASNGDKPEIGHACDGIREGYFKNGVGKHIIYYRHTEKSWIEIVRILHGRIQQHL